MSYAQLWRRVPAALGFVLPGFFISVASFVTAVTLTSLGVGLLIIYVGFPILSFALLTARGFGAQELKRLQAAGEPLIEAPLTMTPPKGFWARSVAWLKSPTNWRYLAYQVASFPLYIFTFSFLLTFAVMPIGLPYWLTFGWWLPSDLGGLLAPYWGMAPFWAGTIVYGAMTAVGIAILPFMAFGFMKAHWWLAEGLLGRRSNEELKRQVSAMSAAEGRTLRSLERDIHDGPQQQLLRLQMDLASARRRLSSDPEAAEELIKEAQDRSAETLAELRRLSKGIAPPLLQDRGLVAAVEALAERNLLPTSVEADETIEIPSPLDQNAYFVISELYANAVKHSNASRILTEIRAGDGSLRLRVTDDGKGGAQLVRSGGLAGIEERVHGLGGSMILNSPAGGPTSVTIALPF